MAPDSDNNCCEQQNQSFGSGGGFSLLRELIPILCSSALLGIGLIYSERLAATSYQLASTLFFIPAYLISGWSVLSRAGRNILRGFFFDENFLMSLATIGAICIGEFSEAVGVMLFFQIGELFQRYSVGRARTSIKSLIEFRPQTACLLVGDQLVFVEPFNVNVGDHILVRPGEKIPLDGEVIKGFSVVDTSMLTGESLPRSVERGEQVLAGCINQSATLEIIVTRPFVESSVARIFTLVEQASSQKAPTEKFITRFARVYTPIVVLLALLVAIVPPVFSAANSIDWLNRALVLLVISCPCGLVISIPLGYFGGIGAAAREGILIKGSVYLDALCKVGSVVFDKTGTLTRGVFSVTKIIPAQGFSEGKLLEIAAYAESRSNHPIAESIQRAFEGVIDQSMIEELDEVAGHGIRACVNGQLIIAGTQRFLEQQSIATHGCELNGTVVHLGIDGQYAGCLLIADQLKPDSLLAVSQLHSRKIKVSMLTGDNQAVAESIALSLNLDEFLFDLLPEDKVEALEKELVRSKASCKNVVYVGDGINDAPVIALADVGMAMGGLGSDAAIETADIVLMTDSPAKVVEALEVARRTRHVVVQNITFALSVKLIFILLASVGEATLWEAVFADVGVALLAILNATRLLRSGS